MADDAKTETKHEKFVRIINGRMEKTVVAIGRLVNLGNKAQYDYTEDEALQIKALLDEEIGKVYEAFGVKDKAPPADPDAPKLPEYGGPEWKLVGEAMEALDDGDSDLAMTKLKEAMTT